MLKGEQGQLYDGVMTWRVTGTLECNGLEIDAVLAEGKKPGDFWWETTAEDFGGGEVAVPPIVIGGPCPAWDEVLRAIGDCRP